MVDDFIPVRVRECPDGTHPDGDVVFLRPTLSLTGGIAAQNDFLACRVAGPRDQKTGNETWTIDGAALSPRWYETFTRYGAAGWTLHDPDGPEWPFDVDRLLADFSLAFPVADRADDLYRQAVMAPLGLAPSATSRSGGTGTSTSQPTTPTRSPRSSSSGGRTAGARSKGRTR